MTLYSCMLNLKFTEATCFTFDFDGSLPDVELLYACNGAAFMHASPLKFTVFVL